MNDFIWYSRLAVWAGALVLAAQAFSGRGASFMTPLATIALGVGFVCFVGGLVAQSYSQTSDKGADRNMNEPPAGEQIEQSQTTS